MIYRILHVLFLLLVVVTVKAQINREYYNYIHYTTDQGLPHSLTFDIKQSKDGFIWIASNNGLGRFDGYDFKNYRPSVNNTSGGIGGKSITLLFFDGNNHLWSTLQGKGLSEMNLDSEKFTTYTPGDTDSLSISGNDVFQIIKDNNGVVWIATNKGIDYFDTNLNRFVKCFDKAPQYLTSIRYMTDDSYNRMWFLSHGGIGWFDKTLLKVNRPSDLIRTQLLDTLQINSILIQDSTKLWIGSKHQGLLKLDLATLTLERIHPEFNNCSHLNLNKRGDLFFAANSPVNKLMVLTNNNIVLELYKFTKVDHINWLEFVEDHQNNSWVSSEEGLLKISPINTVSLVRSKMGANDDLLKENVHCRYIDNQGNLWLSVERRGVIMVDLNQKKFSNYKHLKDDPVISGNNITTVFEDSKGQIWTGCYSIGLSIYNPKTQTSHIIPYDPANKNKIIYKAPSAVVEDADGYIWVGFYDGNIMRTDKKASFIEYYTPDNSNPKYHYRGSIVRSIIKDKSDNLWFTTNLSGIVEYNWRTKQFIYHSELYEKDYNSNSHYRTIFLGRDNNIWFGTQNGGLGKYDINKSLFTHFVNDKNNPKSIAGNIVYHIHQSNDSVMWIATDKGLSKFNVKNNDFTNLLFNENGSICAFYRIYPDESGNLWLSGDCGIAKINEATLEKISFVKDNGLPSSEFNTTAGFKTKNGEIFFGSSNGLVSFLPQNIIPNPYLSKPGLTNLKLFNKVVSPGDTINSRVVLEKNIFLSKKITLDHDMSDVVIEFSSFHFASPGKNQFQYKLEPFNTEWISSNASKRWVSYTGLPAGKYLFKLKSTNGDGIFNAKTDDLTLEIEILPPFIQTNWFKFGVPLLILIVIFALLLLRIQIVKRQKRVLEETVLSRTLELKHKNEDLVERQKQIETQNEELEQHRYHLENLVDERTIELQNALLKAEDADRLKSAFLANMSHEIRTPMNAIMGFSSLLIDDTLSNDEKNQYAEIVLSNGEALLNLLNDILDRSIIESGKLKFHKREVELNKLLFDTYLVFKNNKIILENSDLELRYEPSLNKDLIIFTDPVRLSQVLNNLVGNAIKFTSKGYVSIRFSNNEENVLFEVSDSGIGMDPQMVDSVFNRFQKIENPEIAFHRGAGLGLSICKSIVEMLGGTIWATSEPNVGSTFYFTLPIKG